MKKEEHRYMRIVFNSPHHYIYYLLYIIIYYSIFRKLIFKVEQHNSMDMAALSQKSPMCLI